MQNRCRPQSAIRAHQQQGKTAAPPRIGGLRVARAYRLPWPADSAAVHNWTEIRTANFRGDPYRKPFPVWQSAKGSAGLELPEEPWSRSTKERPIRGLFRYLGDPIVVEKRKSTHCTVPGIGIVPRWVMTSPASRIGGAPAGRGLPEAVRIATSSFLCREPPPPLAPAGTSINAIWTISPRHSTQAK